MFYDCLKWNKMCNFNYFLPQKQKRIKNVIFEKFFFGNRWMNDVEHWFIYCMFVCSKKVHRNGRNAGRLAIIITWIFSNLVWHLFGFHYNFFGFTWFFFSLGMLLIFFCSSNCMTLCLPSIMVRDGKEYKFIEKFGFFSWFVLFWHHRFPNRDQKKFSPSLELHYATLTIQRY